MRVLCPIPTAGLSSRGVNGSICAMSDRFGGMEGNQERIGARLKLSQAMQGKRKPCPAMEWESGDSCPQPHAVSK